MEKCCDTCIYAASLVEENGVFCFHVVSQRKQAVRDSVDLCQYYKSAFINTVKKSNVIYRQNCRSVI